MAHTAADVLIDTIADWGVEVVNEHPKPFVWTKTSDEILASVERFCRRISDSGH